MACQKMIITQNEATLSVVLWTSSSCSSFLTTFMVTKSFFSGVTLPPTAVFQKDTSNTSISTLQIPFMMLYPRIGKVQPWELAISTPKMVLSQMEEHLNNFGTVPKLLSSLVHQPLQRLRLLPPQLGQSILQHLSKFHQIQVESHTHVARGTAIFVSNQATHGATNQRRTAKGHAVVFTEIHTARRLPLQLELLQLLFHRQLRHLQLIFQRQESHVVLTTSNT
mmetsp:Transcript_5793/g.8884  ORF Transcript_5793/g.8884 Transcript_5793/m.8884 type:complete len:223 (-) Transcript_5793:1025-1693(-)